MNGGEGVESDTCPFCTVSCFVTEESGAAPVEERRVICNEKYSQKLIKSQ